MTQTATLNPLRDVEQTDSLRDVFNRIFINLFNSEQLMHFGIGKLFRFRESDIESFLNSQFQPAPTSKRESRKRNREKGRKKRFENGFQKRDEKLKESFPFESKLFRFVA